MMFLSGGERRIARGVDVEGRGEALEQHRFARDDGEDVLVDRFCRRQFAGDDMTDAGPGDDDDFGLPVEHAPAHGRRRRRELRDPQLLALDLHAQRYIADVDLVVRRRQ